MSRYIYLLILGGQSLLLNSQSVAWGFTLKNDLYTRYVNPSDGLYSASAGSALINIGLGPKLWIGGDDFTVSPEVSFMYSPFALSSEDFKGMGAISFPAMVKFEFLGLSNKNKDGKFGFALGAGYQWSRTELYGLSRQYREDGVERSLFRTLIVEADVGFGISGFDIHGFIRYGFNGIGGANTLNVGIGYDFNIPKLIKETDKEF